MKNELPKEIQLEEKPCPMGCEGGDELVLTGIDWLHNLPGEFSVVRCRSCGLMRTNPRPTPDTIGYYYPDDYGPYIGSQVQQSDAQPRQSSLIKRMLRRLIITYATRLPEQVPGRMLEIGCASGLFMHQMTQQGWDVQGIEFSPSAAENALVLGYPVHTGPLETTPEPKQPYDLIVGWMVLEHLHNPLLALQKLYDWSKPGGWLVASVPNSAAWGFRLFKNAWYDLHLPNHLYHYTPKTLGNMLEKKGWKVDRIIHHKSVANIIASIGYLMQKNGHFKRLSDALIAFPQKGSKRTYRALLPLAFLVGIFRQSGRMTIWTRRKD